MAENEVYYGGTVTVKGRNMISHLMTGETMELTRIVVGKGEMPEGVEPIDMEDLVDPVALATSTVPVVEDGVLQMVVEYRNDMNGGLQEGFWLREFGIYARTDQQEEILLYYATLGNSPQPVNAYKDNRIDTRRYPISIALALDAEVTVSYNPGAFITAEDAEDMLQAMVDEAMSGVGSAIIKEITVPAEGWVWRDDDDQSELMDDEFMMQADVECEEATAAMFPSVALDKASLETAKAAGLCPTIQALDGIIRFWARNTPDSDMTGTLALLSPSSGGGGGGSSYVLPPASSTVLGGVRIKAGSGLKVSPSGDLSVDAATAEEAEDIYDDPGEEDQGQ